MGAQHGRHTLVTSREREERVSQRRDFLVTLPSYVESLVEYHAAIDEYGIVQAGEIDPGWQAVRVAAHEHMEASR